LARVEVPLEVFQRGQFPPVCVKTGRPAELVGEAEVVATTGGAWWLVRVLPGTKGFWPASRRALGNVPITRTAARRIAVMRWAWVVAFLAGGLIVRGAGSGSMLLAGRGLVVVAGALWLLASLVTVEGRLDRERGTVELYDVHPRFKAAVEHGTGAATQDDTLTSTSGAVLPATGRSSSTDAHPPGARDRPGR
jgi:hypothetical protein